MKIAFLSQAPFIGGAERSLQTTLIALKKHKEVEFIVIIPKSSPMEDWCIRENIAYFNAPTNCSNFTKKSISNLAVFKICYKNKVDIIHSNQHWSFPCTHLSVFLLKIKTVCHLRDPIEESINWWLKVPPSATISVSQFVFKSFISTYRKHRKSTNTAIINPVNFEPPKHNVNLESSSSKKIVFGFVGQISPVKNLTRTLELLSQITSYQWEIKIAGEAQSNNSFYLKECVESCKKLKIENKVHFLGFVEDLNDFYNQIDCLILLSKREPLGRVPLEAAYFGVPSIVSDVDGLPETVVNGKTGYLIGVNNDAISILNGIDKESLFRMGLEAKSTFEKLTSASSYAKKIVRLYKDIVK